jgi:predicted nicotinamide N-methyase
MLYILSRPCVVLMIIQQLPSEDFGLHVWPSALFLSDYIWAHRKSLEGELVVELGSGIGLPGEKSLACDF